MSNGEKILPDPVAIIGVGLRLPQADRLDQFWRHLDAEGSLISCVSPRRWVAGSLQGNRAKGNHTRSAWIGRAHF